MKFKFPFSLKGLKKINRNHLILAALAGVLLLVIALPTGNTGKEDGQNRAAEQDTGAAAKAKAAAESNSAYKKNMELQLEKTLGAMEGVGQVEVMLTVESGGEVVLQTDASDEERTVRETDSEGGEGLTEERSYSSQTVLSGSGDSPYVTKELCPKVTGAVVSADGGGDGTVKAEISGALEALFDLPPHKIKVLKRVEES